ncbi:shikimate kinase [Halobacteriales archaeon QS_1_68_20]|nr:MAG: shikimate kinase [Halobacteriales archaeon QS_1_68_20]
MNGRAEAPAAGTVVNALATGTGSAFAIDEHVRAAVDLSAREDDVQGEIAADPDADATLIERCVELVVDRFGDGQGGTVRTESDVPMASGLKSSSAAANAAVLATLDALDVAVSDQRHAAIARADAARIGVRAARDVGVTVTGAFDDASASMLGGVTVTDNREDELLAHERLDAAALVWTPPERAYSADTDVDSCRRVAPVADVAADLALAGEYGRAMTVNGFAFCAALDFPTGPMLEALPDVAGVSLSGTGPSYVALGDEGTLAAVRDRWADRAGAVWLTTTNHEGARRA